MEKSFDGGIRPNSDGVCKGHSDTSGCGGLFTVLTGDG